MARQGREEHREFVTGKATDDRVPHPCADLRHHHFAQPARNTREQLVARGMAQRVVDALEPVQVDEEQGGHAPLLPLGQQAFDLAAEAGAIGKPGHLIEQGKRLDMVEIGADLTEQAFQRDRQIRQFQPDLPWHRRLEIAMGGGQQAFGGGVDGRRGGGDGAARRRPAHRTAQNGDDQRAADLDDVILRAGRIAQHQRQDEHQRARGAGKGSGAAFQRYAVHLPPYPRKRPRTGS